jgi:hypothetical protein
MLIFPRENCAKSPTILLFLFLSQAVFANPTVEENRKAGTEDWRLSQVYLDKADGSGLRSVRIEGYADKTSLYPGDTIGFHISTAPAAAYNIDIFRTGYYDGKGARYMTSISSLNGTAQLTPETGDHGIHECSWDVSTHLMIPDDWPSGVYLAKLTRWDDGYQSYIIFIVKSRKPADLLFQCSDLSWQAYNKWPGHDSLYDHESKSWDKFNQYMYTGKEARVSFDRPYALYAQLQRVEAFIGSGEYLLSEFPLAYWLEKEGYHVAYCSNLDTDNDPTVLDRCKLFLSVAHDEYWTDRMITQVQAARDRGVSLAFLSGNALLHAVDLQPSNVTGKPARAFNRDHYLRDTGRELMGETTYGPGNGDWQVAKADHWIFKDTGLKDGDAIRGLVGWEYHGPPFAEKEGLEIVAMGEVTAFWSSGPGIFGAVVYPGPKGNWVFNAGTIWWSQALSEPPGHVPGGSSEMRSRGLDTRVQTITKNFLQRCLQDSMITFSSNE